MKAPPCHIFLIKRNFYLKCINNLKAPPCRIFLIKRTFYLKCIIYFNYMLYFPNKKELLLKMHKLLELHAGMQKRNAAKSLNLCLTLILYLCYVIVFHRPNDKESKKKNNFLHHTHRSPSVHTSRTFKTKYFFS